MRDIIADPGDLIGAEAAETTRIQMHDVDERDEVHARLIETVPAVAARVRAEAVQKFTTVTRVLRVMFTRHEMNWHIEFAQNLLGVVELLGRREVGNVAGMDDEIGLTRQRTDLRNGL